jgi:hypothetical protein
MKKYWFILPVLILFSGCSNTKIVLENGQKIEKTFPEKEDGDVVIKKKVEIYPGKNSILKSDGTGKTYTVMQNAEGKAVFVIRVSVNLKEPMPDSGIEHTLSWVTDLPVTSGKWKDEGLKNIHAVYGFHAFHPESGYKPLAEGEIRMKTKKNKIEIVVNIPGKAGKELNGHYEIDL